MFRDGTRTSGSIERKSQAIVMWSTENSDNSSNSLVLKVEQKRRISFDKPWARYPPRDIEHFL